MILFLLSGGNLNSYYSCRVECLAEKFRNFTQAGG